ncbi:hypothetical protein INT45_012702 [Circinella minor]|uniref:ATP-dependent DNA helicase n=1 Tax=Circinella minor TaxID=1195481 RepID=A0A8H7RRD0_9FUNG|nr:hypothetical protein INT45_012702 [Circinella minor]
MSMATSSCTFIPTSPPQERQNILDHYSERPSTMDNVTLASFVAWYNYSKNRPIARRCGGESSDDENYDNDDNNVDDDDDDDDGEDNAGNNQESVDDSNSNSDDDNDLDDNGDADTSTQENTDDNNNNGDHLPDGIIELQNGDGFIKQRKSPKVIRFRGYRLAQAPLDYYRELVMLYLPWRDEEIDVLLVDCETTFRRNQEAILANRREFTTFDDATLMEALENVEREYDDPEEEEDPQRLLVNPLDEYELDEMQNEQYVDVMGEAGAYERVPYQEMIVHPERLDNDEYEALIASLNTEQRDFVFHVKHTVDTTDEPFHYFLTGGAGTGKSLAISALYQMLTRSFDENVQNRDREKPSVLLCAPTGMAAYNILGQTIHSLFHLPVDQYSEPDTGLSADIANTIRASLAELRVVIIDEISMVGQKIFRLVDQRLQQVFGSPRPFGGLSVIVVGDFNQLPPVRAQPVFSTETDNPYITLFGQSLWDLFRVYRLTTVMRQREDGALATALNNMSNRSMTPEDIELMRTRTFNSVPNDLNNPIFLFHKNADVDAKNTEILLSMTTQSATCTAIDRPSGNVTTQQADADLRRVQRLSYTDTMGLRTDLFLRIDARYMVTTNIDTSDGLVNGAMGYLRRIDIGTHRDRPDDTRPLRVWIEFMNERTGRKKRENHRSLLEREGITNWTPISHEIKLIKRRPNSPSGVVRIQFPLTPAQAITIHKSQGQTYDVVVIVLTEGLTRFLIYVACSRARTAAGLHLIGVFRLPRPNINSITETRLAQELARQQTVALIPCFQFLHNNRAALQLIFHNVQSLNRHIALIRGDEVYLTSNFILLAETWTLSTDSDDSLNINGFTLVTRQDSNTSESHRRAFGTIFYIRNDLLEHVNHSTSYMPHPMVSISVIGYHGPLIISTVYALPRTPIQDLISALQQLIDTYPNSGFIFAGDFNVNFNIEESRTTQLLAFFSENNLSSASPTVTSTTPANTKIDDIFTNFPQAVTIANTYVSLSPSSHKPLYFRIS